ncbi:Sodium/calcium exchanger 3 [Liparis tanakae]|uniref:Sodium/calcium exchanger 3 n=1 Tax=Liparis tanakae TaxID=230148 RepID=A0A4Z2G0X9_9TELE|nr:Sodium/calcium exchanger 3 [Liparis tanakae]
MNCGARRVQEVEKRPPEHKRARQPVERGFGKEVVEEADIFIVSLSSSKKASHPFKSVYPCPDVVDVGRNDDDRKAPRHRSARRLCGTQMNNEGRVGIIISILIIIIIGIAVVHRVDARDASDRKISSDEEEAKRIAEMGKPVLGEHAKLEVIIEESYEFKSTVDKLIKKTNLALVVGTNSWREQFMEAITVSAGCLEVSILPSSADSRRRAVLSVLTVGIESPPSPEDADAWRSRTPLEETDIRRER